ncbi:hypothetical protein ACIG0C_04665 [Kitasatospora aureofaciens]|uniref:Gram-positive cocci surface proteins LPxTG domain-containing protein n=1 Tax=Kitasatospora aureofaciens TaxID=1894 RepID=A0A8H9HQ54_KITAU|nr:hypothetical protein [Kitasatospora aureofaciens]UKZ06309.1 hypothetical protein BOQ63_020105 [Streptomyces viridifaciens]GGU76309.1 hypothetical protein GCM10010502_30050 [Kitasatospora aureofaciens]
MTELSKARRAAVTALLAAGLALVTAQAAHADLAAHADTSGHADTSAQGAAPAQGDPEPVPAADLARAHSAVQDPTVLDKVGHFFARKGVPPTRQLTIGAAEEAKAAQDEAPRLAGDTVPVYTLDAGFVAGTPGAPVAKVEFTASKVVAADGQTASVWTVRQGDAWRVVNIASGGDESDYAAKAADGGGTAFREPQVNAWYVLRDGRVLPLDDEARRSVGAGGVSLAAYQKLVHQRYGDKLPGSTYDREGRGGGYRLDAAAEAGPGAAAQAAPQAAADHDSAIPAVTAAAALGATALAAAGVGAGAVLRRKRAIR